MSPPKPVPYTDLELDMMLYELTPAIRAEAQSNIQVIRQFTSTELWRLVYDLKAQRELNKEATAHAQRCTEDLLKAENLSHYAIGKSLDRQRTVMDTALAVVDGDASIDELKEEVASWRQSVQ